MAWLIEYKDTIYPLSRWRNASAEQIAAMDERDTRYYEKWRTQEDAKLALQEILGMAERNAATLGLVPPHEHMRFQIEPEHDPEMPMLAGIGMIKEHPPTYGVTINTVFASFFSKPALKAVLAHELGHVFCGHAEHEFTPKLLTVSQKDERHANRMAMRIYPVPEDHLALLGEAKKIKHKAPKMGFLQGIMLTRMYPSKPSQVFDIVMMADELAEKGVCKPVDETMLRKLPKALLSSVRDRLNPRISGAGEGYYGPCH